MNLLMFKPESDLNKSVFKRNPFFFKFMILIMVSVTGLATGFPHAPYVLHSV